jgi:hypothetical protein
VSDVLLAIVAVALLAGTGLVVATAVRVRGPAQLVLAAYVIGFVEIVSLSLVLSPFEALTRRAILVGLAGMFAAAVTVWFLVGAPRPPRISRRRLHASGASPELLVLAVATGLGLAYVVALIVGTAPNNWDSLSYHLARAALWSQKDRIGYVADAYDERLNASLPNSEIALAFLVEIGRNEHLAGFVQLAAALAIAVGVFALARKLGLPSSQAAFGSLLVLTLPIVVLQASTTQNDLVAASFLVTATVFLLGDRRPELILATLATALAIGTKIPAAYGVPLLVAVAIVAPRTYRIQRLSAILVGTTVGSYWYVLNIVRTGNPLGDVPSEDELVAFLEPTTNLLSTYARVLDAFDLSGAAGMDILVYAGVAILAAAVAAFGSHGDRPRAIRRALATGALVLAPFALLAAHYALWRVFAKVHDVLGAPDGELPVQGWESQTVASDSLSWFGPLGLLLVVGVGVVAVALVRRGSLPPVAIVMAAAPLAWLVLLALSLAYDEWQGRFFVYPVALSAALWGLVLPRRALAVAAVALASTTAVLSLAHFREKPSGLRLLEEDVPSSVWGLERWQTQSIVRNEMTPVLRFVEDHVPRNSVVALALGEDDFGYPPFGERLDRTIELVPDRAPVRAVREAAWLVASPGRSSAVDESCWRVAFATSRGWRIFARSTAECPR